MTLVAIIMALISGLIIAITFFVDEAILYILKDKHILYTIWRVIPYIATIFLFASIFIINVLERTNA